MQLTEAKGQLAGARVVRDGYQVMLISDGGTVIRCRVDDIKRSGRATQGVIVMRLREGEHVSSLAPVVESDEDKADARRVRALAHRGVGACHKAPSTGPPKGGDFEAAPSRSPNERDIPLNKGFPAGQGDEEDMAVSRQVDLLEPIDLAEHLGKVELYLGQVCQIAGISKMQLDYWTNKAQIPTKGKKQRIYDIDALETVMLIKQAKDKGLNLGAAIDAARRFRESQARHPRPKPG